MGNAASDKRLLIVWHSRTGASETMALEAAEGAHDEIRVDLLKADDTTVEHVLAAAAFLFVCPENLGTMSGSMKEFFDRSYYPVLGRIEGRPYGTIIAAGSDGTGAERQLDRIVTGWRLNRVIDPLIVNFDAQDAVSILAPKRVSNEIVEKCREIGATLGAGAAMGVF
ncbi:MAG: NAD(P)H-dependent oxidoreductase [Pseudomonadota bacterium]